MKSPLRLVAVVTMLSCFGLSGRAQTSSATISGHVVDQSQGIVTRAKVTLINQRTNVIVTTQVRPNGDFIFADVQPGTFSVIVQAPGYKELKQVDLRLSASQNLSTGTLTLQIGEVSQSVTVAAAITPLQTTSSERSGVLDTEQLENLLAIGRDSMALTRVLPGVVEPGGSGGYGSSSLGTSGTPTVNGVNSEYNLATIDGVTGNTRGLNTLDTPLNLDAVQQVTLMGSNYQAQYGKTAGGNFNFITKNGTNQFHGGLYYYFRNEDLNANSYFNKFGNSQPRPRYRYNTIGGTIGGPIFWPGHFNRNKNKLFFFVSIEDSPITQPDGLKNYMVPTKAQISGDFSQTYNQGTATQSPATLIHIKMPGASGACATNSATAGPGCVPGNIIPPGLINTQMQALLQIMYDNTIAKNPQYAFTNLAVSNNNYNYQTNFSADKPVNQEVFRIDYAPTEKIHMFGRGELTTVNDNDYSSPANTMTWLMPVNYKTTNPNAVFNITYTFSPTVVNELNLGTAGWSEHQLYAASDLAKVTLGAGGFNLPSLYAGVNPLNLFPATSFGGTNAANYGWDSRFPMADQVRSWTVTDNVTKVLGNHTLKFGVDWETDTYLQVNHNRVGTFNTSVNTSNPNESNYGYANALFGNLNQYSQTTQLVNYDPTTNAFEFYYQDTWKATPKLVLDLGIRNSWAMAQGLKAGNNFVPSLFNAAQAPALYQYSANGASALDPTTGVGGYPKAYAGLFVPNTGNLNNGILYVSTPGYPQGTTYGNGLLWGPRVGFAYSVTPSTVIRGGFGMYYNVRARSGQEGDLTNNAPTTNAPTQYYSNVNSTSPGYYASTGQSNLNGPFTIGHALPLHSPQLYTEEASIGVQHQLPAGIVLDVAYVGTFTKHASAYYPINNVPYNSEFLPAHQINPAVIGSGTLPDNFFRPYPGFGSINDQIFNLTANYNALQARATRRYSKGLEFGVAYTYAKALDYGSCSGATCSESYNFTAALYQNLRTWNYGPAGYDIKHDLVVNFLWGLPRASRLWNNVVTRGVLDNWQISGIASYISGAPNAISLSLSNNANVTGGGDGARVVLTCDPSHNAPHTFTTWFNPACVEAPIAGSVPTAANPQGLAYSTGTGAFAPKVNFFLPGDTNFDTALFKNMPIKENLRLQLRVETYNTFNHAEFNGVNNTATFANANTQANPQTQAIFGQMSTTLNPRLMQLALRLDF